MRKSVKRGVLIGALVVLPLIPLKSASGQTSTTLRPSGDRRQEKAAPAAAAAERSNREQLTDKGVGHEAVVLPQPPAQAPVVKSADSKQGALAEGQAAQAPVETTAGAGCSLTMLLVNEVSGFYLVSQGVPCLGCTISTDLSQSAPGILAFSKSATGPWTETLTVSTTLDFSGNGTSELFYVKGLVIGPTIVHAQNFWSSTDLDFEVVPCACPEIPVVP